MLLVLSLALLLAPSPAHAVEEGYLEIEGAGWGHTVGMSQYGAYGRAIAGEPYQDILSFYYEGSSLEPYDTASPGHDNLVVNLEYDRTSLMLRVLNTSSTAPGGGHVPATVTRDGDSIDLTAGQTVHIDWNDENSCEFTFRNSTNLGDEPFAAWDEGRCDADIVWDGEAESPSTKIEIVGCSLPDWDSGTHRSCQYGRGARLSTIDNESSQRNLAGMDRTYNGFDLVLEIDIDDYTYGISEVSSTWPTHALRAQAAAARSYAAAAAERVNPMDQKCACDVYDTSASQRYVGWGHIGIPSGVGFTQDNWIDAADATDNLVITHPAAPDNDIVSAVYSSSNGGATQNNEDIWGGAPLPYLRSNPDPLTLSAPNNPYPSWTYTKSLSTMRSRLNLDSITGIEVAETYDSGTASRIVVTGYRDDAVVTVDTYGGKPIDGVMVQSWHGLRSPHITGFNLAGTTPPPPPPPPTGFTDIDDSVHRTEIEYLADLGIALACDVGADRFCPDDAMRREDIAAFLARALDLPATETDYFTDDNSAEFEDDINRIAAAGITKGCNPPTNDRFCPDRTVTRGQMAAFLVRAWGLTDPGPGDWFTDDDRSVFEGDIDRLAESGMTRGCNPPSNSRYCPDRNVTRGETASFLARALQNL